MVFTHEASIPLAAGDVHLDKWLFQLSENDYKACVLEGTAPSEPPVVLASMGWSVWSPWLEP